MKTILILIGMLIPGLPAHSNTIELRQSVRLGDGTGPVILSDIAVLNGEEAQRFGNLVVTERPEPDRVLEIGVEDVRQLLEAASVNWGKVHLTGRKAVIRPRLLPGVELPQAMTEVSLDPRGSASSVVRRESNNQRTEETTQTAVELISLQTVKGLVATTICEGLKRDPSRVRLEFDSGQDPVLDMPLDSGRYEIAPGSSWMSDRVHVTLRRWNGVTINGSWTISVSARVLADVPKATRSIARLSIVGEDDVTREPIWLSPSELMLIADGTTIVGMRTTRAIEAGERIHHRDIRGETLIRKGDRVKVRKMVGVCVITMDAEATSDAGSGEIVMLSRIGLRGRKDRTTFPAMVTGPGEAMLTDEPILER